MAEQFDAEAALNRAVAAIAPFRQRVNAGNHPQEDIEQITQEAMAAGLVAVGVPITEEVVTSMLLAAILRIADIWLADQ